MSQIKVLHSKIDVADMDLAITTVSQWALGRQNCTVAFCNAHSIVTAWRESAFQTVIESMDLALPDGAPVAWAMRVMGAREQKRISGPDFMWSYMARAEKEQQSVFLFGNTENTLTLLQDRLEMSFPSLQIAGAIAPPFRLLSPEEDEALIRKINASGAHTIWVSLGCPKQERWIHSHRHRINGVMLGVGAAFSYHAGTLARAPIGMQKIGLEWLYRLYQAPRLLWRRYLVTNSLFILGFAYQWLSVRPFLRPK